MTNKNSGNVILGYTTGVPAEGLYPFLLSLKKIDFDGQVVLFCDPKTRKALGALNLPFLSMYKAEFVNSSLKKILKSQNLRLWKYFRKYGSFSRVTKSNLTHKLFWIYPWADLFLAPHCIRYFHYLSYLLKNRDSIRQVLLADTRDIYFQSDPFSKLSENALVLAWENEKNIIKSNEYNREWIRAGYGEIKVEELGDCRISCSGTTMGSIGKILDYLNLMVFDLVFVNQRVHKGKGIDQGVHNRLLHEGRLPEHTFSENGQGPILTLAAEDYKTIQFSHNQFLNNDGEIIPIIHQYDRFPELSEMIQKTYSC